MKRLKTLLAVIAAMAMLVMASSLAMASPLTDTGGDHVDDFGQPWGPQAVTDLDNYPPTCPGWATHQWTC